MSIESRATAEATDTDMPAQFAAPSVPAIPAVAAVVHDAGLMGAIVSLAADPRVDVAKLKALMELQSSVENRQAERAFNAAFVRLQARLPRIKRDGTLEYPVDKNKPDGAKRFIAKFAKWETIDRAIRPIYTDERFAISFHVAQRPGDGGGLLVSVELTHADGHSKIYEPFPVSLDTSGGKNNNQAYGSTLSYGKKYAAFAALNLVTEGEDDEGVAGSGPPSGARLDALEHLISGESHVGSPPDAPQDRPPVATEEAKNRRKWVAKQVLEIAQMTHAQMAARQRHPGYSQRYDVLRQENPDLAGQLDRAIAARTQQLAPPE